MKKQNKDSIVSEELERFLRKISWKKRNKKDIEQKHTHTQKKGDIFFFVFILMTLQTNIHGLKINKFYTS